MEATVPGENYERNGNLKEETAEKQLCPDSLLELVEEDRVKDQLKFFVKRNGCKAEYKHLGEERMDYLQEKFGRALIDVTYTNVRKEKDHPPIREPELHFTDKSLKIRGLQNINDYLARRTERVDKI